MKKYKKIVKFTYKNQKYQLLLDNERKYFFLRINEYGKYEYVTIEELIELMNIFCKHKRVLAAEKDKNEAIKFIPKVLIKGVATTLTLATLLTACSQKNNNTTIDYNSSNNKEQIVNEEVYDYMYDKILEQLNPEYQVSISTPETEDNDLTQNNSTSPEVTFTEDDDELVVETYIESDWLKYIYVYDMDYLNKILNYNSVSTEEIHKTIDNNPKITDKFKPLLHSFVNDLVTRQPDAEIRVLYENLKTLEIVECTQNEMMLAALSTTAAGCYVRSENKIYVLKDYEYKKGTWEYQIIYHELCHCLRTGQWDTKDKQIRVQCEGLTIAGITTPEALNSLFSISLFDYEEKDIAYQLQSNIHQVMIECLDNYKLSDYVNHSLTYYASKLDEHNGDKNYATTIFEIIESQYKDYHDDDISIEQEEFYPLYDYVADMYFRKYINETMSYSDAQLVAAELIDKIMYDVPEDYNIDTNRFYDYLQEYCESKGMETTQPTM